MVHVARRLLGAFLVLGIVAGATLAVSSRPRLSKDRTAIETDWAAVRSRLDARYARVDALGKAIDAAGGPPNATVADAEAAFSRWRALTAGTPVATSITVANDLEGFSRRLAATVAASALLKADASVKSALTAMLAAPIPSGVTPLEDAVARYEKDRGGPLRRLVAGPLGYSAIPRLALATGA